MPQSLARVYLHIVFSTKNRESIFRTKELRDESHAYLAGVVKKLGCQAVEIGGMADHVHLLVVQSRTITIADLVKETKRVSTGWIQEKGGVFTNFRWQAGYGVFSVSQSNVEAVAEYVRNQEEHHRRMTFQDEYRALLKKHAVVVEEMHLWD
ncbi:IS200/IS605 family transposase [Haloferula sp.]|uniref:IS200/IS605 family transposase n=1 Tax=Haloferula sp. TaxID=2497595 RepID=UPI003C71D267